MIAVASTRREWLTLADTKAVAQNASEIILQAAQQAIDKRGAFHLLLAGGSTPAQIYRLLAKQVKNGVHWHLYLGDERCLPAEHPGRNSRMIHTTLLSNGQFLEKNIHFIAAENGPEMAAKQYAKCLQSALPDDQPFDLVLLGMGEDGHTASLFPGQSHPRQKIVHAVYQAPKPPPERVSVSANRLSNNRQLLFVICGEGKKNALMQWQQGVQLPISTIRSRGITMVTMDEAATPPAS